MKYPDFIRVVGLITTILLACIPYFAVFFKVGDDARTRAEQILLLSAVILVSVGTLLLSRRYLRNVARVEGFAWGYFYNFVYELSDLIIGREAEIEMAGRKVVTAQSGAVARLLIIIPSDLHSEYRISELMASLFADAVISPTGNSLQVGRRKVTKAIEAKVGGQTQLVLIDTPPTTMRAIRLYQESCCNIDHNDAFEELDSRSQKEFNKICLAGKRNIAPQFKAALDGIVAEISKGSRRREHRNLIKFVTLQDVLQGVVDPGEFDKLNYIGDNIGKESLAEKSRVLSLLSKRKESLIERITELAKN